MDYTHELTEAVVTHVGLVQDQTRVPSRMEEGSQGPP